MCTRLIVRVLLLVALVAGPAAAGEVRFTLLAVNDLYELTPVGTPPLGGIARLAALKKRLVAENPHTWMILAGDFLSPSALGTAVVDGQPLAGRQMVAALNAAGLDWAIFGNHEFDIKEDALRARLAESRFRWLSTNVSERTGAPFPGVARQAVFEVPEAGGGRLRVGLVAVTLPSNPASWVRYADPLDTTRTAVAALRSQVDVLVAITHQALADDQHLIEEVPGIDLVVGGHEHENLYQRRGPALVPLVKADANARTAWVLRLAYDTTHRRLSIAPELVPLDAGIGTDPGVEGEVNRWLTRAFQGFRAQGFDPDRVVARTTVELDGREASVRTRSTTLTALIAQAIRAEDRAADLALYNSGGIRLDDVLPAGDLTQYDIIRVLPFGNRVVSLLVRGDILRRVLAEGERLRGSGGFLQWSGVSREGDTWLVNGRPLDAKRTYRVATIDFLAAGRERGLEFFKPGEPGVSAVEGNPGRDLRFAFIDLLASCKEVPVHCSAGH